MSCHADGESLIEAGTVHAVDEDSFLHLLILDGEGCVCSENKVDFRKGDSLLLTASTGIFEIQGTCEALLTTIPGEASL